MLSFIYKALRHHSKTCPPLHFVFIYLFILLFFAALLTRGYWRQQHPSHEKKLHSWGDVEVHVPEDVKVVGLVFYGRKEFVEILDCYLKRNLKDAGGLLDEVVFSINTDDVDDLAYLEELLTTNSRYSKHEKEPEYQEYWTGLWSAANDPNTIYIKIDDDVVFMEDQTIPVIVKRLLECPRCFAVSANVVNNPALSWVHLSMDVYEPFYPEMEPPEPSSLPTNDSWRISELPFWSGPSDFHFNGTMPAPYEHHRWLPVPDPEHFDIERTPVSIMTFDPHGPSWHDWAACSQLHYSFLSHLEKGDLYKYKFNFWDYHYKRLSINFFGLWGRDIVDSFPFPDADDEQYLTVVRPKEVGRHVVVDGAGIAVHFAFGPQRDVHDGRGILWTDLLDRYRAYANTMVCPFPTQKMKSVP